MMDCKHNSEVSKAALLLQVSGEVLPQVESMIKAQGIEPTPENITAILELMKQSLPAFSL